MVDNRDPYFNVEGSVTTLSFNGSKLLGINSIIIWLLVMLNIVSCCAFSISCSSFLPTVSFVGSLKTHDKLLIATCTLCCVHCQLVVIAVLSGLRKNINRYDAAFTYVTLSLFSGLLLTASIIDEVGGFKAQLEENFHSFYSFCALIVGAAWLYFVVSSFSCPMIKGSAWLKAAQACAVALGFVGVATLVEWQLGNSVYSNFLMNESVEAICEWGLIALAVTTPALVVQALPEFRVTFSLESPLAL